MNKTELYSRLLDLAFIEMLKTTHKDDLPKKLKRFYELKSNITDNDLNDTISDIRARFDW